MLGPSDFPWLYPNRNALTQYPHCDALVLHAPGKCEHCDWHPAWQKAREYYRVLFTGEPPRQGWTQCPSTRNRPLETIEQWPGNVASSMKHYADDLSMAEKLPQFPRVSRWERFMRWIWRRAG